MSTLVAAVKTPTQIRDELVETFVRDLLGPAGGPNEEVDEREIIERYLVGLLAPKRQEVAPEQNDEFAVAGKGTPEEGTTEPASPPVRTMFPSSFGLSFCVDLEASGFQAEASWGQYKREDSETATKADGQPKLVWRRHPRGGGWKPQPLVEGAIAKWEPDPDCPDVYVTGRIRKRADHWSVTLFLVNAQQERRPKGEYWLFQPRLAVSSPSGEPIFHRRFIERKAGKSDLLAFVEQQGMEMLYRHRAEFAVGHGVGVHAEASEARNDRAARIETAVIPRYEVARATGPTEQDFPKLAGLVLDMKELAESKTADIAPKIQPLLEAYANWIAAREVEAASPELAPHRDAAEAALERCRGTLARIQEGLALLSSDETAAEAFRFANRAMWLQRTRSLLAERRRHEANLDLAKIDIPQNRSWRPFQLAFILLNLPGITRLDHPDRISETQATCDLLWFSTGGGKTEAYLGLAAYTMGIRRLQGDVAGRPGEPGVAVLMRYTLRLLTIQQFQRAAALLCACEAIRRAAFDKGDRRWGAMPFRLGLWVGQRTTPNTTDQADEVVKQSHGQQKGKGGAGTGVGSPYQLTFCPWCGAKIDPGRDIQVKLAPNDVGRTLVYCGDPTGRCLFTPRKAPNEGMPVLLVDEEIYRLLPAMLIATVDKFAQMPWNGKIQMLFGQVDGRCERHGFRSPEVEDSGSHPAAKGLPPARTVPQGPVRPPDLIIQDELHLISGPLGTLVGLYETALDWLCTWTVGEHVVRPKVIASTATIRRAQDQVNSVFQRQVSIFPPQGLDIRDCFFALERPISEENPGRLYVGVCAPGRRLKAGMIRAYVALLAGGQRLYSDHGVAADPWMTLVGYFNSMRELGGMRRLVDDDIRTRAGKADGRGLAKRTLPLDSVDELTSRKSSTDIPLVLDRLELKFDPVIAAYRRKIVQQGNYKDLPPLPLDVLLATNMVSVGVDVKRLGLMVVCGQPKSTSEYIQATSRVGRNFPGFVCTVYNWARPRDLSHYEKFEHYHATFHKHVEALSVTPFSPGAIQRGLTALLVSCVRLPGLEFNENKRAANVDPNHACFQKALDVISRRAELLGGLDIANQVRAELKDRIDQWRTKSQGMTGGSRLGYKDERDGVTIGLLQKPGAEPWEDFTCLNSLRDVEPTVNLLLLDGRLDDSPDTVVPIDEEAADDEPAGGEGGELA